MGEWRDWVVTHFTIEAGVYGNAFSFCNLMVILYVFWIVCASFLLVEPAHNRLKVSVLTLYNSPLIKCTHILFFVNYFLSGFLHTLKKQTTKETRGGAISCTNIYIHIYINPYSFCTLKIFFKIVRYVPNVSILLLFKVTPHCWHMGKQFEPIFIKDINLSS